MAAVVRQGLGMNMLSSRLSQVTIGNCCPLISFSNTVTRAVTSPFIPVLGKLSLVSSLHTSSTNKANPLSQGPRKFLRNNDVVYPPTPFGEKERHAYVCHMKTNIKYSPKKMWYIACLVRGLKIDDAINQLKFVHKKGAVAVREALEEAQALAVQEHNVEFKSNLWVSESFVGKGPILKGMRRHARRRFGQISYKYCHYFVTLEEGEPPEHYYYFHRKLTGPEMLEDWKNDLYKRNVPGAL